MGSRDSDRQRLHEEGGVAPGGAIRYVPTTLLPFEKNLADSIGLTEQEYLKFRKEIEKQSRVRPAEYAHIPEIVNAPAVPVLINLAIGLVLTGVSYLLTPKPKAPDQAKQRRNIKQDDLVGPSRYNTTYGFDSVGDIATWNTTVPIIFGKLVERAGLYSGGIIVNPDLVWSRLFSYGNQQVAKLLYAAGEYGAAKPNKEGIYVGTQPLSKLSDFNYAVYYRSGPGNNRIKKDDLILGTRGNASSGDPENNDDVFTCPTADAQVDEGFCMTYTPSGDTSFGIYEPHANGTIRRVNWRIVSFLNVKDDEKDPGGRIGGERRKICGEGDRDEGMPGVGRSYGRQLGIVAYKSPNGGWSEVSERSQIRMDVGWKVKYLISDTEFDMTYRSDDESVNSKDIQNASVNERVAADQSLQLGETIQVGRMTWVVRNRSKELYREGEGSLEIELEAIERFGTPFITVIKRDMVTKQTVLKVAEPGKNLTATTHVGLGASVVAKQAMAVVRPTRRADLIEVGIRSQVWQQLNGLCNFQELPSTELLAEYDEEGSTTLTNGNMNLYATRSSCFTVKVRPAGMDNNGQEYEWAALNNQFVVTGRRPVDVYNYLRFQFPQQGQKYEFRFEPLPGDICIQSFADDEIFEQLDAANGKQVTVSAPSGYGTFTITYTGRRVAFIQIQKNPELNAKVKGFNINPGISVKEVTVDSYQTSPIATSHGKAHGWRTEVLGIPAQYPGQTRSRDIFKDIDGKRIGIRVTATSLSGRTLQSEPGRTPALYSEWRWSAPTFEVIETSGNWQVGDTFQKGYSITRDSNNNNKWLYHAKNDGATTILANFRVLQLSEAGVGGGEVEATTRQFAGASQVADISYYPELINHSNSSSPEHQVVYVNEMISNDTDPSYFNMNMFGLSARSTGRLVDVSQLRYWIPGGVPVERTYPAAYIFDEPGERGRSNLFTDLVYYLLTNKETGAGDIINAELIDKESFELTSKFLVENKIFCDTVVQDQINIRDYATERAPLFLCNFVIKEGKFAMVPAVPVSTLV